MMNRINPIDSNNVFAKLAERRVRGRTTPATR
jgi:hypothetical protein